MVEEKNNQAGKSLRDAAKEYEPMETVNISVLGSVSTEMLIEDRTGTNSEGKEFKYKVTVIDGKEYRVPLTVLKELKAHLEARETMTKFKVSKKGEGMNTEYTVIPLD